jgi:transposase InsO family protein
VKRCVARKPDDEDLLKEDVDGYRRITASLKSEGWKANHKRVERLWRELGLKVPKNRKTEEDYI